MASDESTKYLHSSQINNYAVKIFKLVLLSLDSNNRISSSERPLQLMFGTFTQYPTKYKCLMLIH